VRLITFPIVQKSQAKRHPLSVAPRKKGSKLNTLERYFMIHDAVVCPRCKAIKAGKILDVLNDQEILGGERKGRWLPGK